MNSILFFEEECSEDLAICVDERATYLYDIHEVREGSRSIISVWNRGRGSGICTDASKEKVQFKFTLDLPAREKLPVHFIIGASRPQTTKKVLQFASMSGASSLFFVGTDNGEKSYLSSKVFTPKALKDELSKGLEQSGDCNPPEVEVCKSVSSFLLEKCSTHGDEIRLLAQPGSLNVNHPKISSGFSFYLAIGPEAGWSDREVASFKEAKFLPITLGERVLRVEFAAAYLLGAISC